MTEALVDPAVLIDPQSAFLDSDPTVLRPDVGTLALTPDARHAHVAAEIAAAIMVTALLVRRHLMAAEPQIQAPAAQAQAIWVQLAPVWLRLATPAIQAAIELGQIQGLSGEELGLLAADYAEGLGNYINQTSSEAFETAMNEQLSQRWSPEVAQHRAGAAYGLDRQQIRSYLNALGQGEKGGDPVPPAARSVVDSAFLARTERIGTHEAYSAAQAGQTLGWIWMESNGRLPAGCRREWDLGDNEEHCATCLELGGQQVPLREPFVFVNGAKIWAPRAHGHCYCRVRLIVPEQIAKESIRNARERNLAGIKHLRTYHRDALGRFAEMEGATLNDTLANITNAMHTEQHEHLVFIDPVANRIVAASTSDVANWVNGADSSWRRGLLAVHNHPAFTFSDALLSDVAIPSPADLEQLRLHNVFGIVLPTNDLLIVRTPAVWSQAQVNAARASYDRTEKRTRDPLKVVDVLAREHGVRMYVVNYSGEVTKAGYNDKEKRNAAGEWTESAEPQRQTAESKPKSKPKSKPYAPAPEPFVMPPPVTEAPTDSPFTESIFTEGPFTESIFSDSPFTESPFTESPFTAATDSPFTANANSPFTPRPRPPNLSRRVVIMLDTPRPTAAPKRETFYLPVDTFHELTLKKSLGAQYDLSRTVDFDQAHSPPAAQAGLNPWVLLHTSHIAASRIGFGVGMDDVKHYWTPIVDAARPVWEAAITEVQGPVPVVDKLNPHDLNAIYKLAGYQVAGNGGKLESELWLEFGDPGPNAKSHEDILRWAIASAVKDMDQGRDDSLAMAYADYVTYTDPIRFLGRDRGAPLEQALDDAEQARISVRDQINHPLPIEQVFAFEGPLHPATKIVRIGRGGMPDGEALLRGEYAPRYHRYRSAMHDFSGMPPMLRFGLRETYMEPYADNPRPGA